VINEEYFDLVESLELRGILTDKVKSYFKKTKNDVRDSEGTETERWTTKEGGFCGFFQDTVSHSSTYTVVKAGFIRNSLEDLTDEIEDTIDKDSKNYLINWKKSLYKTLVSTLRNEVGDDALDITLIRQTIRGVLNTAKYPEISYNGDMPSELKKSGTLKNYEAENF
jgi:prenyltransferase beta subunit